MKYKLLLPPLQTLKGLFSEVGDTVELEDADDLIASGVLEAIVAESKEKPAKTDKPIV